MTYQPPLTKEEHRKICLCTIFINQICKECGRLIEPDGHIQIGLSDKIPLKGN